MAGSVTVTTAEFVGLGLIKTTIAWVSDAAGAVSGNAFAIRRGWLQQVKFIPDSGGTQPTDLYDITLKFADGIDMLVGTGANLSATVPTVTAPQLNTGGTAPVFIDDGNIDLVVANAGASKGGTVILYIGVDG